ncbi:MAG: choice-of-anchor J domain-containing protein [Candidatus Cloacimonadaceae bacterium]
MKAIIGTILILMCSTILMAQWHIDEGFEGITTLPQGWSVFDDGDGLTWRNFEHANAHTGSRAAFVDNYLPNQNADWLITPQISVNAGDNLEFYTRAWYGTEDLKVYVSTTLAQPGAMSTLLLNLNDLGNSYEYAEVSLSSYIGMNIYIGFFWECSTYGILLDDVRIGQEIAIDPELNLPESVSMFLSDSLTMDFSDYITCSDISMVSLSSEPSDNIDVTISGLNVHLSSNDFVGSEALVFTLYDGYTGLIAIDTLEVIVLEDPAVDLYFSEVISPRVIEYQNLPMIPVIEVSNGGWTAFNDYIDVDLEVYSSANELLHSDALSHMMELSPGGSAILSMSNSFIPADEEELRFEFTIGTEDSNPDNNVFVAYTTIVYRFTSGGPDTFGYRYLDSNDPLGPDYDWIEISETGASSIMFGVNSFSGDDNFSEAVPLGFSFPFYGENFTTAYIDINGEILLAPNNWQTEYPDDGWDSDGNMFNYMYPIPGYVQMPALIAVYWDDLEADEGVGNVFFETFGTAPNRYTVVQWNNLRFRAGSGAEELLKFQVILHENGEIKMQYHTVATGQTGASIPHDFGASSTVAIQNRAANSGLPYLREIVQDNTYMGVEPAGNLLHDGLAIVFYSGEDDQDPIITHKAKGNTFMQHQELIATIIDMTAPINAEMHYNTGEGWTSVEADTVIGSEYYFNIMNIPLGSTVSYYFEATDGVGNTSTLPVEAPGQCYSFKVLPTADSKVLIAYSGTQDYNRIELPIYENLLTELNIDYDIYNWEEYSNYEIPDSYQGIIAYANTGSANEKMHYFATQLSSYLDSGTDQDPRNLWFASDGLASSQHAHPNSSSIRRLMSGYFRTSYVASGFGGGTNGLGGPDSYTYVSGTILALPGTPVGTVDMEYPVYANSPDCIFPNDAAGDPYYNSVPYPEIGAEYIYAFEDGPIGGQAYLYHGIAATAVETPSFRTLYFSFDFSQLSNPNHRMEWIQDLMNWWDISTSAIGDANSPVISAGITNVYPNPFNPTTNIAFTLSDPGDVRVEIYNIKGQKVKVLMNENKNAGMHTVVWDGTDDNKKGVASGVYYVRFSSHQTTQIRKLTMIK